ncbi:MAG: enoyl-[acyl-carrier-protein] reductase FabK [Halanaerobiaceae bacterium]
MKFQNKLCDLLEIKYPVFQGGMAWVATGELAAAVSEAGGLGIIGAGNAPAEVIDKEIKKVKENTQKSFGVNVMLLSPFVEDIVDLVIKHQVPVVTTGAGNPGRFMDRFKEAQIKVIPVVPSVALAVRMERLGVDALVAEGTEAGGHIGKLTTMSLLPQVVDQVDIPVIAAGGIADGRGVAASFCLGASGVQLGTRFVCSEECTAHQRYKEAIIKARDRDAAVTGRSTGHPVRNLRNKLTRQIKKMEEDGAAPEEIEKFASGKLREAVQEGNIEEGSVMAGQISGLIKEIKPAAEIITEIIAETKDIFTKMNSNWE